MNTLCLNKSFFTNFVALLLLLGGIFLPNNWLLYTGLFALSGAITNWLAVYMLFEKIPGLVGSGVIPNRFEQFKGALENLVMEQFFSREHIERFMAEQEQHVQLHLAPIIERVDLSPAFDRLVHVIMESSFGTVLGMFGGASKLESLREPFIENMQSALIEMTEEPNFKAMLHNELEPPDLKNEIHEKVQHLVHARLEELTPDMVKTLVQQMIKEHLGWLVVWGGVFGGIIGLISAYFMQYPLTLVNL